MEEGSKSFDPNLSDTGKCAGDADVFIVCRIKHRFDVDMCCHPK